MLLGVLFAEVEWLVTWPESQHYRSELEEYEHFYSIKKQKQKKHETTTTKEEEMKERKKAEELEKRYQTIAIKELGVCALNSASRS